MKHVKQTVDNRAGKAVSLRRSVVSMRPERLASLALLNLIIVILLISGMRGLLA